MVSPLIFWVEDPFLPVDILPQWGDYFPLGAREPKLSQARHPLPLDLPSSVANSTWCLGDKAAASVSHTCMHFLNTRNLRVKKDKILF